MELPVLKIDGSESGKKVVLDEKVFGIEPNDHAIYLDVVQYLANQRQGTAKTKDRSEIAHSTKKLGRQKGGGGARHGSLKANIFVGGGRVFGPKPRLYRTKLNKKVKALARHSALTYKAQENADWECVGCHKINKPDAKFCRYCGTKKPEAAPVKAYFTPVVQSDVTYKTGNPMKVIFFIVAAVGIIANLMMLGSVSSHKDSLKELVDKNYYYTLNKIEYDFVGYSFILLIVSAAAYLCMAIFRKKPIGLVCAFVGPLFAVLFSINSSDLISQLNVKMTLPIAALSAAFVVSVLYCFFDKLWLGIINICAVSGAVYLLLNAVNKANINYKEPTMPWLNLCGNAVLMLLMALAARRERPQTAENSASASVQ